MQFINIHTHNKIISNEELKIIDISSSFQLDINNFKYTSIGLHPWHIKDDYEKILGKIADVAAHKNVKAIGEAGLDRLIPIDFNLQKKIFIAQAEIAQKLEKPMIIHAVKSIYEIITLRKDFIKAPAWLIHGFTGNKSIIEQLEKYGILISIGPLFFKKKDLSTLAQINLNHLFFETDDLDIPVKEIYENTSQFLNIPIDILKLQVSINFIKHFDI